MYIIFFDFLIISSYFYNLDKTDNIASSLLGSLWSHKVVKNWYFYGHSIIDIITNYRLGFHRRDLNYEPYIIGS